MNEHQVIISKNCCQVTDVKSVDSFSEKEIRLKTTETKLFIYGDSLKVVEFSEQTGSLKLSGNVNQIKYSTAGQNVIKRLFK